jgi:hypothetical protein
MMSTHRVLCVDSCGQELIRSGGGERGKRLFWPVPQRPRPRGPRNKRPKMATACRGRSTVAPVGFGRVKEVYLAKNSSICVAHKLPFGVVSAVFMRGNRNAACCGIGCTAADYLCLSANHELVINAMDSE